MDLMQKPPVIILAGGATSRFFPFNAQTHKGLISLHGQTLLERTIRNLQAHEFREIVLVVTPRDQAAGEIEIVAHRLESELEIELQLAVQPEALGMGDAVLRGLEKIAPAKQDQIAVISPYQLTAGDLLSDMIAKGPLCLCTSVTDQPSNYGMVHFNSAGEADGIIEKPTADQAPSDQKVLTTYVLSQEFIRTLQALPVSEYNFEEALNQCLQKNPAPVWRLAEPLTTLKYGWDLWQFQHHFFAEMTSFISPKAQIATTAVIDENAGPVWIEAGVTIGHASRIVGPAYIGQGVTIGDFCLIRSSSLETAVLVGAHSEVSRSIMMPNSSIHRGFVGDSIIGHHTKLGAGFVTANKRFDRQPVMVEVKGKLVTSGRTAFGALIGDQVQVGTNVSTMPGVCIGSRSSILPGTIVKRNLPHNSQAQDPT